MKGGKNNDKGICMPYFSNGNFYGQPPLSVVHLVLRQLEEAVHKRTNGLHFFICPKLIIAVWVRILFKMADLVVYSPKGGRLGHP